MSTGHVSKTRLGKLSGKIALATGDNYATGSTGGIVLMPGQSVSGTGGSLTLSAGKGKEEEGSVEINAGNSPSSPGKINITSGSSSAKSGGHIHMVAGQGGSKSVGEEISFVF